MTQNKMVVEVMAAGNKVYAVTGQGYKPHGDFILNESWSMRWNIPTCFAPDLGGTV